MKYPVTSGNVIIKKRGNTYFVKDVKTGVHGKGNKDLNELLLLCDGTKTIQEIAHKISHIYEKPLEDIQKTVVTSIEKLTKLHLVTVVDTPAYTPVIVRDADLTWPLDMVYLEITNSCNLNCIHCYKTAGDALPHELTTKEWGTVIDELAALGVFAASVTGGEPFMRKDLFDILTLLTENTIGITLFTNGTLLTEEYVKKLKRIGLEKVAVSIDGTKKGHENIRGKSTFDKTVKGIKLLIEYGLTVRSNTLVYTGNIHELEALIQLLLELGVNEMVFDRFMGVGRGECSPLIPHLDTGKTLSDIRKKFEDIHMKYGDATGLYSFCGIGTSMVTITAQGDVVLCPVLSSPDYCGGNVRDTLRRVWDSPVFQPLRDCNLDTACGACPFKSDCKGGCKARVFQHYETFCMPDPWMCAVRGQAWPEYSK